MLRRSGRCGKIASHSMTALRQFLSHLETGLFADDTWGPILNRFQALRHQKEVSQTLKAWLLRHEGVLLNL
jgi:hypothetical protein